MATSSSPPSSLIASEALRKPSAARRRPSPQRAEVSSGGRRLGGAVAERPGDRPAEVVEAGARLGAGGDRPGRARPERSALVQTTRRGRSSGGSTAGVASADPAIEEQVGPGGLGVAEGLGLGVDRVGGGLDAGGVDQLDDQAVAAAGGGQVVAGRAGDGGDDRLIGPDQGVEQPALARRSAGRRARPGASRPAGRGPGSGRRARRPRRRRRPGRSASEPAADRVDVGLVDEVEPGLDVGEHVEQAVPEPLDRPGEAAGELLERRSDLGRRLRVDHREHRLGPRQVDPTRQEGPERELAGLGQPGAAAEAGREDRPEQGRRADRVDLGHLLPGEGPGARPEGDRDGQRRARRDRQRPIAATGRAAMPARSSNRTTTPATIDQAAGPESRTQPAGRGAGRAGDRGDRVLGVERRHRSAGSGPVSGACRACCGPSWDSDGRVGRARGRGRRPRDRGRGPCRPLASRRIVRSLSASFSSSSSFRESQVPPGPPLPPGLAAVAAGTAARPRRPRRRGAGGSPSSWAAAGARRSPRNCW